MNAVPIILIFAAIGWIVYINLSSRQASTRAAQRLCLNCGYDLRASDERCPECGLECYRRLDMEKLSKQWPKQRLQMEEKVPSHRLTAIVHETLDQEQARLLAAQFIRRGIPAIKTRTPFPGQNSLFVYVVCVSDDDKTTALEMMKMFLPDETGRHAENLSSIRMCCINCNFGGTIVGDCLCSGRDIKPPMVSAVIPAIASPTLHGHLDISRSPR